MAVGRAEYTRATARDRSGTPTALAAPRGGPYPRRVSESRAASPADALPVPPDAYGGAIVDMHVHTRGHSSDSTLDPAELPRLVREAQITGVNLSEHHRVWDRHLQLEYLSEQPELLVNFGIEVSTDLGHMLAVGLTRYEGGIHRAERLRAALDRVGGFLIVAHPFRHAFETRSGGELPLALSAEQAAELPVFRVVDAVEIANGCNTPRENYFAAEVARIAGLPTTGGSDAHSARGVGYFATGFESPITSSQELLEALHARRFHAVHRTASGRLVRFGPGSLEAEERLGASPVGGSARPPVRGGRA